MGLIKAALSTVGGALQDQFVDFFAADSLSNDILMAIGKRPQQARSINKGGTENVISNGSKINVADGQCMIIVENGRIVDYCSEPGQYTYNNQVAPSLLGGGLRDLGPSFKELGRRFAAGGAPTTQQFIYFVNTKEIINNKIGWGKIPFRHFDPEFDRSIVVQVQGFGMYTFSIADPLMFYKNIAGNIADVYRKETLLTTMKSEVMSALNPALGKIAQTKIPYDELIMFPDELGRYINESVGPRWGDTRGITIRVFAVESITVDEESQKKISQLQQTAIHMDPGMAAARLMTAQANAMEGAANNTAGAMTGFMGMGMAQGMGGGTNAADLFAMSQQQREAKQQQQQAPPPAQQPAAAPAAAAAPANNWTCACGSVNTGRFCAECGTSKPEAPDSWTCSCGTANTGRFCQECGGQRTAAKIVCAGCGWEPEAGAAPRFCPECGGKF